MFKQIQCAARPRVQWCILVAPCTALRINLPLSEPVTIIVCTRTSILLYQRERLGGPDVSALMFVGQSPKQRRVFLISISTTFNDMEYDDF